jgi:WD40 repeat protein
LPDYFVCWLGGFSSSLLFPKNKIMSAMKRTAVAIAVLLLSVITTFVAFVSAGAQSGKENLSAAGKDTIRFRPKGQVVMLAWTRDSKSLATLVQLPEPHRGWDTHGGLQLWDAATGKEARSFDTDIIYLGGMAFYPDNKSVALGGLGGYLARCDLATGKMEATGSGVFGPVHLGDDGKIIFSIDISNQIAVYDAQNLELKSTIVAGESNAKGNKLPPVRRQLWAWPADTNKIVALADNGTTIRLIDVVNGKLLSILTLDSEVKAFCFSPDGSRLATGGLDRVVHLWDVSTRKTVRDLPGHVGAVNALSWSPDGKYLASTGADKTVRLWDIDKASEAWKIDRPLDVEFLEFSPDSKRLAYSDSTGTGIWDTSAPKPLTLAENKSPEPAFTQVIPTPAIQQLPAAPGRYQMSALTVLGGGNPPTPVPYIVVCDTATGQTWTSNGRNWTDLGTPGATKK